jgi:hypothetical protein
MGVLLEALRVVLEIFSKNDVLGEFFVVLSELRPSLSSIDQCLVLCMN